MKTRALISLLVALALPTTTATAQADWRIDGFAVTETGFRGTLLFRNGQVATDSPIYGLTHLQIYLAPEAPLCRNRDACFFGSNVVRRVGRVDTRNFTFGGDARLVFDGPWSEDSCVYCISRNYAAPLGLGVLGCPAPVMQPMAVSFYAGRTCLAENFDGWFALPFEWRTYEAPPSGFVWNESHFRAQFTYRNLGTENAFLVPEPQSLALLLAGGLGLAAFARRVRVKSERTARRAV